MPNAGHIRHSEANARKIQVLALQAKNAIDGLLIIDELRNEGVVDFNAVDFPANLELGAFEANDFSKALDCAREMRDNNTLARLVKIIKMY